MISRHYAKRIPYAAVFGALALNPVFTVSALGQGSDLPDSQADSATVAERSEATVAATAMEEVIVRGQRPLRMLIREGEELTADFYTRLNEVLNNDDFVITCENERRAGSNFNIRVCMTAYQRRILNRISQDQLRSMAAMPASVETGYAEMLNYQAEFENAILVAVNTDQVLNDQVIRLMALKQAVENYQTPRQQRREQRQAEREAERNTP